MELEMSLGELYDDIAGKLAESRTLAMQGKRTEALETYRHACLEWTRFRKVLCDYPGFHALDYAFDKTLTMLYPEDK